MEITLIKQYKSNYGITYKAGDKIECDKDTYNHILELGCCEEINNAPAKKKKAKVKVKPEIKKEKDGANS